MAQRTLHLVRVSAEQAVVKRGVRELLVSGADAVPVVADVVEELGRGTDPDDVLARSPEETRPAVEQLVRALRARGFLRETPPGQDDLGPDQRAFFDSLDAPPETRATLGAATVVVLGRTMIARSLLAGLDGLPLAAVRLADLEPDPPLEPADLLVATSDAGDLDALLAVNRRAIEAGRPFLPVWVEPGSGWVGPLVVPGQAACLRCWHGAWAPGSGDRAGGADGVLRSLAGICGRIAAMEVVRHLTACTPPAAVGRVLRVDAASLQATPRRVFKNPRCTDCSEVARHRVPVVLTGPQIPHG